MGVVTVSDIDYGQIFGPFPTHVTATDPAYVIGMLTSDRQPDGVVLRVDTEERRGGVRKLDWLPYVSPARDEEEQNMEAYPKEGGVYYRTLRIVKAGEELLVWYSKDFTQILGVPELQSNSKRDDEQYICSHCGEMFDFPYPLRAHLKFKCTFTAEDRLYAHVSPHLAAKLNGSLLRSFGTSGVDIEGYADDKKHPTLNFMTNNNSMFSISSKRHLDEPVSDAPPPKKLLTAPMIAKVKKDSTISHSIEELSKSHVSKPRDDPDINRGDTQSEGVSAFRKVSSDHPMSPLPIITSFPAMTKNMSPPMKTPSPSSSTTSDPLSSPVLTGCHAMPVPKTHSPVSALHSPSAGPLRSELCTSAMPPPVRPPVKTLTSQISPISPTDNSRSPIMGLYMPRIPLIPTPSALGIPGGSLLGPSSSRALSMPHSAFPDQIPPGLLEMCRATIPAVGPLTESFAANIRNSENLAKQALFADRHISTLGFLKSTNPMVEKLLQSTNPTLLSSPINALNLSQNWCAKCNATFRMTSDLVYHMRSHHKREFDPMKRRREEKLKCNICNEAFRERHHLTRHMSSHA
ncbi:hypothetical protein Btru_067604 [Bulinus truncatus]|nr:hypothetical protein Btru_067604 [Bulinus truncatus]